MEYIKRRDGSKISYKEFGSPIGLPFLYCHGFPASCLEAKLTDEAAKKFGARIIAIDRPGYGYTDFIDFNTYLDWADDVELLLQALSLERFVVLGVSGGAPYAFAITLKLTSQVIRTGVVCGVGSVSSKESIEGMGLFARQTLALTRKMPGLAKILYGQFVGRAMKHYPELAIKLLTENSPKADQEVLGDNHIYEIIIDSIEQAFIQGGRAATQDLLLLVKPWNFSLQDIKNSVYLWHGEADSTVPPYFSRRHEAELPYCQAKYYPDEGHFSLPVKYMDEIIQVLVNPNL